ncbi:M3 family oligoendopeptidase [Acholeplasma sp. OttesenSCG-928-E16]|nr:M3 family oligoendopeptidase [Acholeplasma sp. OttesenSCG-928-E16]
MKFKDFKYERPNLDQLKEINDKTIKFIKDKNEDPKEVIKAVYNKLKIDDLTESMISLVSIRNSIDTIDEFYEKEMEYWDNNTPILQALSNEFNEAMLTSPHRKELEGEFGSLVFSMFEQTKKTFSEAIIPFLQKENKLSTEYSKLIASAKIEFDGQIYNLSQMSPFIQNVDRDIRKRADSARNKFFMDNEAEFDRIYDELVKVRHEMAITLGYKNYIELGYDRLGRLDYDKNDVRRYREQIFEDVVPAVCELEKRKANRLRISNPQHYDIVLEFLSGNPTPKGDREWMVDRASKMYHEMSNETGEFIDFMIDKEVLDLDSKPNKTGGGYCSYIAEHKTPFIFANFNGTSHDVDVLTHEAGHAFQVYQSRDLLNYYRWPTMEAAEIHSMSMEFFAWPWINLFFMEDTTKYKYTHLAGALTFLPYGVTVDEFQHFIYENPAITSEERKKAWREIERKYMPYKIYDEDPFLEKGTWWYRQGHIFSSPFYYIDYTLAQVCAFQYWIKDHEDHEKAWNNYLGLCKLGGSKSFVELITSVGLDNPFKKGTLKKIIKPLQDFLGTIDDSKL